MGHASPIQEEHEVRLHNLRIKKRLGCIVDRRLTRASRSFRSERLAAGIPVLKGGTPAPARDGTTTATILARAIFREGLRLLAAGFDAMELKRGIDAAVEKAVEAVKAQAKPVKERERIAQVGTVSANGDATIGELFAEAMDKVGQDGVI